MSVSPPDKQGRDCQGDGGTDGVAKPAGYDSTQTLFFGNKKEASGNHGHEHGGQKGDDVRFATVEKINSDSPKRDDG